MNYKSICSSLYYISHINPPVARVIIDLSFDIYPITFFLITFLISNSFWLVICNSSSYVPTIPSSLWSSITYVQGIVFLYFLNYKYFLTPNCCVSFCKYVSMFWYFHMVTNFKFRVFVIMMNTIVNICTRLNITRFHFNCPIVIFVNYFIKLINVYNFWYCNCMLVGRLWS